MACSPPRITLTLLYPTEPPLRLSLSLYSSRRISYRSHSPLWPQALSLVLVPRRHICRLRSKPWLGVIPTLIIQSQRLERHVTSMLAPRQIQLPVGVYSPML